MSPEAATELQNKLLNAMTAEQRRRFEQDCWACARDILREGIRHRFPDADEAEVERQLQWRIQIGREIDSL